MMPVYWLGERLRLWKTRGYARDQLGLEIIDGYRRLEAVAEPDELVQVIVSMFDAELWGSEKPSILAEKVVEKLKDAAARWAESLYRELRRARDEKYKQRVLDEYKRLVLAANSLAIAYWALRGIDSEKQVLSTEQLEKLAIAMLSDVGKLSEEKEPPSLLKYIAKERIEVEQSG